MKKHPNGAGTILPGKKQVKRENKPLADWPTEGAKTIIVPVELSPAAYALVKACAAFMDCGSAGEYILLCVKSDTRSICGALEDASTGHHEELFAIKGKEEA